MRWQHPSAALLAPADFSPLAEETGLIIALGYWVLDAGLPPVGRLANAAGPLPPLTISVNLPAAAPQTDLALTSTRRLRETGLAAPS